MTTKIAINGFGHIGRMVLRALVESGRDDLSVVAINDLAEARRLAHLLKYDGVHGRFPGEVTAEENSLTVKGQKIIICAEREPENLPWNELGIDIIMECTGFFLRKIYVASISWLAPSAS